MSIKKEVVHAFLFMSLLIVAVGILGGAYLIAFHENPAAVIYNNPMPTDKLVYSRGDTIYFTIQYCRYTTVPTTTYISFVNFLIYDVPPRTFQGGPAGCGTVRGGVVVIPDNLPPGKYHLIGKNKYDVNFLVSRYTNWHTAEFEIK